MAIYKPMMPILFWNTNEEMLKDVLHDLRTPAIRKYLLSADPAADVCALTLEEHAVSHTFTCSIDTKVSNGFQAADATHIQVHYPAWRDHDLQCTVGVTLESNTGEGAVHEIFAEPARHGRYVSNARTNSSLCVYYTDKHIEFSYLTVRNGFRAHALVWLNRELLSQAISTGDSQLDLVTVQRAMTKTIIGGAAWDKNIPLNVAFSHPGASLTNGSIYATNIVTLYANSFAMLAVPVFAGCQWFQKAPMQVVNFLREWGLRARIQQFAPAPPQNITDPDFVTPTEDNDFVRIAPAHQLDLEDDQSPTISRAERRRIQNRIAAAKSNERRREARRLARQQIAG